MNEANNYRFIQGGRNVTTHWREKEVNKMLSIKYTLINCIFKKFKLLTLLQNSLMIHEPWTAVFLL